MCLEKKNGDSQAFLNKDILRKNKHTTKIYPHSNPYSSKRFVHPITGKLRRISRHGFHYVVSRLMPPQHHSLVKFSNKYPQTNFEPNGFPLRDMKWHFRVVTGIFVLEDKIWILCLIDSKEVCGKRLVIYIP